MNWKLEQLVNDTWEVVAENATEAEAAAYQAACDANGLTARVTKLDVEQDAPESADPAADLASYMAEAHPEPFAKAASEAAPMEYQAAVEDALTAGRTPVDIGRDAAIQALARAAGKSPNPTTVTRYAQNVRRAQANAADAAAGFSPAGVEGAMQEPTDNQPTPEVPALPSGDVPAEIGPLNVGDVIYAYDNSQHVIVKKPSAKSGRTACGMKVQASATDWTRLPGEPGNRTPDCPHCLVALHPDAPAPGESIVPAPEPPKDPKVADTMEEALTPTEPEPDEPGARRPRVVATPVGKLRNAPELFVDTYRNVVACVFEGTTCTHLARHPDDPDAVLTLCGFPRGKSRNEWVRIKQATALTCYGCRRIAGIPNPTGEDAVRQPGDTDESYAERVRRARNAPAYADAVQNNINRAVFGSTERALKLRAEAAAAHAAAKAARAAERAAAKAAQTTEAPAAA